MLNHTRSRTRALARVRAVREHEKFVVINTYVSSSTFPANLERIRSTVWSRHDCSVHSDDKLTAGDNWFRTSSYGAQAYICEYRYTLVCNTVTEVTI
jgi:hypothetical protein